MSQWQWRGGNRVVLLENGEAYYPAVFEAIRSARHEVLIETFILFEDPVGQELEAAIAIAVRQGAKVALTVDGYGSESLSAAFIERMHQLGVQLRMFEPFPRLFGNRVNLFRRLHRKIVVVDSQVAFVGGINFSEDHLRSSGEQSKQDYAVSITGPLVGDIRQLVLEFAPPRGRWRNWRLRRERPVAASNGSEPMLALLASRDNHRRRDDIERLYRIAIRAARTRIVIANAYFFPGYRLLHALTNAAKRGVKVQLILQGNPDMPVARFITQTLYRFLAKAGVEIHEYCERPIHAKVAVIDGEWSTVGSSNLDPLSLSLNLEANVFVADRDFAQELTTSLERLLHSCCTQLDAKTLRRPRLFGLVLGYVAYHFTRYFPALLRQLPARRGEQKVLAGPESLALERPAE